MLDAAPGHSLTQGLAARRGDCARYEKKEHHAADWFFPSKAAPVSRVRSMREYILRRHRRMLLDELNRQLEAGVLWGEPSGQKAGGRGLKLSDWSFGEMSFWRYDRDTLLVDVTVSVSVQGAGASRSYALYCELWADMRGEMDFIIGDSGLLEHRPLRELWRLSEYLVPILRKNEIEKEAEKLLLRYCPNALEDPEERNAYILADRMGLRVERLPLYHRNSTRSMLYFCEGTAAVDGGEERPPRPVTVSARTILINTNAVHKDCCQLEIYHECVHFAWHDMFYRLQAINNNDIQATGRLKASEKKACENPLEWMEWQARRGSFGLMMPLSLMRAMLSKYACRFSHERLHAGQRLDGIARAIAGACDFPKFRVRARLIQMGCIAAKGILNYVDGAYIQPFAFSPANGGGEYSFVIDRKSAYEIYAANEDFARRISSGRYVFADGHVCLNDPRYVERSLTRAGTRLTPWAYAHVDKCCLRFISVYESSGVSGYTLGTMNSDEEYNRHYLDFAQSGEGGASDKKEKLSAMSRLLDELPGTFQGALAFLMKRAGVTIERLEEEAFLSGRTISRLRTEERREYSLDQVIAVCVALHLPPWLSGEMVRRAGFLFRPVRQHRAYQFILDCLFMDSVRDIQKFLVETGCQPLKLN